MGISKSTEYTRKYSDFLGVDLSNSGRNSDKHRFSYAQNMYKDYDTDGQTIESVPGYRAILPMSVYKTNGIYTQQTSEGTYLVVHSGTRLFRVLMSDLDNLKTGSSILSMPNKKSTGYNYGTDLYIMDGSRIIRIDDAGDITMLGEDAPHYVPTIYYNGEKYEQRNLLYNLASEKYDIASAASHAYGTEGLTYSVINEELGYCAVTGAKDYVCDTVYIPSKVKIGASEYKVVKIEGNAFYGNTDIIDVIVAEGVEEIGAYAFADCSEIVSVRLPTSMKVLGPSCFSGCYCMEYIYVGYGLQSISSSAFNGCSSFTDIYYEGSEEELNNVENASVLSDLCKHYYIKYKGIRIALQLLGDVETIDDVKVNGNSVDFISHRDREENLYVFIDFEDKAEADGASIVIEETLYDYTSYFGTNYPMPINGQTAILYCTIAEMFDGKIFFSGNPFLPNTVFYTSIDSEGKNNPLYIGEYNYFNDGVGQYHVTSLLCVRDSLTVFKSGDDGTGSIFYHTKKETGEHLMPVIYPVTYVHSGVCALSRAINFLDDPVFLTSAGLAALQQNEISLERSIAIRSHNINRDLLKEDLSKATLLEWQGYLCVCVNGKIFLADSRSTFRHQSGNVEYEWFIIDPVGYFNNDRQLYRFETTKREGLTMHEDGDKQVTTLVYNITSGNVSSLYTVIDGVKYNVYTEGERYGGTFKPAYTFATYKNLLFFGGDAGGVFIFNNDKRGVPPTYLSENASFDEEEYKEAYGNRIHPDFYSFANHAPKYSITTVYDDCDVPNLTKNTVKHSLAIKYKSLSTAKILCEIETDSGVFEEDCTFSSGGIDFEAIDFGNFSMAVGDYFTIPISEKEKNWVEKRITVYSEYYKAPIGICSITYRYTLKGRIKQN